MADRGYPVPVLGTQYGSTVQAVRAQDVQVYECMSTVLTGLLYTSTGYWVMSWVREIYWVRSTLLVPVVQEMYCTCTSTGKEVKIYCTSTCTVLSSLPVLVVPCKYLYCTGIYSGALLSNARTEFVVRNTGAAALGIYIDYRYGTVPIPYSILQIAKDSYR